MSGGFPLSDDYCNATDIGTNLATSLGTPLPTVNVWVQLTASSPCDAQALYIQLYSDAATTYNYSISIGVGAAGSETAIITDLVFYSPSPVREGVLLPVTIPAGTRISARPQWGVGSGVTCSVILLDGSFCDTSGFSGVDTIGIVSHYYGTSVVPSATANTKGSFTQIIASTARDYAGFLLGFDNVSGGADSNVRLWDFAIGSAGSEIVILPNIMVKMQSYHSLQPYIPMDIPAGTRISARNQATLASAAGAGCYLYGVYR
jgi:hypothetical protein